MLLPSRPRGHTPDWDTTEMTRHVAFLRGINVGAAGKGRKAVPMAVLRGLAEHLGWRDARTYIQSGNLLFRASVPIAAAERMLEEAIHERFGFDVPVIVRTVDDLVRAVDRCPFPEEAEGRPSLLHIGFAKGRIGKSAASALADYCTNGERVVVQGPFLWIDYASGVGRSKLTPAVLDRALGSPVTMRNVKTLRAVTATLG